MHAFFPHFVFHIQVSLAVATLTSRASQNCWC